VRRPLPDDLRCTHRYTDGRAAWGDGRCGAPRRRGTSLCHAHDASYPPSAPQRSSLVALHNHGQEMFRLRAERARVVAEIRMLSYFWDGPGSEGRCV
jgi:hypothetical protein